MNLKKEPFGIIDGQKVWLFTLTNEKNISIRITNYGGIITAINLPDRQGNMANVCLGFDTLQEYLAGHPYFGCIVGRFANRIAKGRFTIDGIQYSLAINNGNHSLHGGMRGFDKVLWQAEEIGDSREKGIKLTYYSHHMEEGYPGNLNVEVVYTLNNEGELKIHYSAVTDRLTHVNLTNHTYFNLNGAKEHVLNHEIQINATEYTVADAELIPTGEIKKVKGGSLDFTSAKKIGQDIAAVTGGYDHNFVLKHKKSNDMVVAAQVSEPLSGRTMEVFTTEPGIQFYTGNCLDGTCIGSQGVKYEKYFGFCLEAQHYPDTPNHTMFPSTLLEPGDVYSQTTIYKFGF